MLKLQNPKKSTMKKLFLILILLEIITLQSQAQKMRDIIYLKNGSIIKGTLVEITADQYKIQTSDGGLFIFSAPEVKKFVRQSIESNENKKSGMGFALEAGFLIGNQSSQYDHPFSFNLIAHYTINTKNILGIGSGVEFIGQTFAPLYCEYKYLLYEKSVTPFLFFRTGGLIHLGSDAVSSNGSPQYNVPKDYRGGASLSVGTGISWATENIVTYLSFAYRYAQTSYHKTDYNSQDVTFKNYYNRLEIKLGFKF
jgi:hypothetical protein